MRTDASKNGVYGCCGRSSFSKNIGAPYRRTAHAVVQQPVPQRVSVLPIAGGWVRYARVEQCNEREDSIAISVGAHRSDVLWTIGEIIRFN